GAGQHPGEADPVPDHAAAHDPDARAVLAGAERVDAMAHGQARPRVRRARRRHDAGRVPDPGRGEHAVEDAGAAVIPRDRTGFRPRLIGSIGLGFVASLFAATTAGWLLSAAGRLGFLTGQAPLYRAWLASGGWLRLPLGGAALAALAARARAERGSQRVLSMGLAAALGALA